MNALAATADSGRHLFRYSERPSSRSPAAAVVLAQKWRASRQNTYEVDVDWAFIDRPYGAGRRARSANATWPAWSRPASSVPDGDIGEKMCQSKQVGLCPTTVIPFRTGRMMGESEPRAGTPFIARSDGARFETATAGRAHVPKRALHTLGAIGALVSANARLFAFRRQVAIT